MQFHVEMLQHISGRKWTLQDSLGGNCKKQMCESPPRLSCINEAEIFGNSFIVFIYFLWRRKKNRHVDCGKNGTLLSFNDLSVASLL